MLETLTQLVLTGARGLVGHAGVSALAFGQADDLDLGDVSHLSDGADHRHDGPALALAALVGPGRAI